MHPRLTIPALALLASAAVLRGAEPADPAWEKLFTQDGPPAGWVVRSWDNVANPPPPRTEWRVRNGILIGSDPRGTWLVSEREVGDFLLEFEFRLGERGNSGVGLRVPAAGDPAFDALEIQLVDPRYFGEGAATPPEHLTGAVYGALPPAEQAFQPQAWNTARIELRGPRLKVVINGRTVQDVNLDEQTTPPPRGRPLAERPRRGRIAFQELGRGGSQVALRNVRLAVLD